MFPSNILVNQCNSTALIDCVHIHASRLTHRQTELDVIAPATALEHNFKVVELNFTD